LGINTTTVVYKDNYSFNIDGKPRKATDVCTEYLESLERMVTEVIAAIARGDI
jgi:hypothetical protein